MASFSYTTQDSFLAPVFPFCQLSEHEERQIMPSSLRYLLSISTDKKHSGKSGEIPLIIGAERGKQ